MVHTFLNNDDNDFLSARSKHDGMPIFAQSIVYILVEIVFLTACYDYLLLTISELRFEAIVAINYAIYMTIYKMGIKNSFLQPVFIALNMVNFIYLLYKSENQYLYACVLGSVIVLSIFEYQLHLKDVQRINNYTQSNNTTERNNLLNDIFDLIYKIKYEIQALERVSKYCKNNEEKMFNLFEFDFSQLPSSISNVNEFVENIQSKLALVMKLN